MDAAICSIFGSNVHLKYRARFTKGQSEPHEKFFESTVRLTKERLKTHIQENSVDFAFARTTN